MKLLEVVKNIYIITLVCQIVQLDTIILIIQLLGQLSAFPVILLALHAQLIQLIAQHAVLAIISLTQPAC